MNTDWEQSLKNFRMRAGYSQGEFANALSFLHAGLSNDELRGLKKSGIEPIILDNSEIGL